MTHADALRKVIACMRLAKSSNPHEAALAAARAQEIMDRYNLTIDAAALDSTEQRQADEPIETWTNPLADVCMQDKHWVLRLAHTIAQHNLCRIVFFSKSGGGVRLMVIGRASDVQVVRYMFGWLDQEVRRITREQCKGTWDTYRKNFRYGVVDTIAKKLGEQKSQTVREVERDSAANPHALMVIGRNKEALAKRQQDLDAFMDSLKLKTSRGPQIGDADARRAGQRAGQSVRITRAAGALQNETTKLKG